MVRANAHTRQEVNRFNSLTKIKRGLKHDGERESKFQPKPFIPRLTDFSVEKPKRINRRSGFIWKNLKHNLRRFTNPAPYTNDRDVNDATTTQFVETNKKPFKIGGILKTNFGGRKTPKRTALGKRKEATENEESKQAVDTRRFRRIGRKTASGTSDLGGNSNSLLSKWFRRDINES